MNWVKSCKKITKLEWICMFFVLVICLFLQFFIDLPEFKFSKIVLAIWCLYYVFFKAANLESKIIISFITITFIMMAFSSRNSIETKALLFSGMAVLIGSFFAIKKRDKIYIILIGAILLLMSIIIFNKFF